MSGHLRFFFAGLVLVVGLSATPASSTPFADFFNNAPQPAVASPPQAECLGRPGNSPPEGQHWVYRMDGHRKCWFLTEHTTTVHKPVHRRVANRGTSPDENETARRRRSAVVDARAELLRPAPAEGAQAAPPARGVKLVDAASVFGTRTAALVPATPLTEVATGEPTPDHPVPRQVDLANVLPAAPVASEALAASVPPVMPIGVRATEAGDMGRGSTATWIGVLLMALGIVSVLSSSRELREAVLLRC
ncbi:hypothetical protein [Bradyrhizobium cosmicum]|uniref:hypothetical protein n=1 Tax=Bradyrhizobium cosmicum TaxID=1404864 RepID=UPI0028EE7221|nr:hypothetical protein [Bradyrhizobium cosmicum]